MANHHQDKIEKGIESGLRIRPYFHFDTEEAWQSFSRDMNLPNSPKMRIEPVASWIIFSRYAAVFLLLLGVFAIITRPVQFTDTLTTKNQAQKITLFDGSVIELAENTTIQYPVRSEDIVVRRVVVESGKATFRVKHNKLPFVVSVYPLEIKVTGTTFTVEKTDAGVFIVQEEGQVEVRHPNERLQPRVLNKGQKIKMTGGELFLEKEEGVFEQVSQFTYPSVEKAEKLKRETSTKIQDNKNNISTGKGLTYMMKDVISFLDRTYKKQLRFKKKRKLKSKETVQLMLDKPLSEVVETLVQQGKVVAEPGKCKDCYILSPPAKK